MQPSADGSKAMAGHDPSPTPAAAPRPEGPSPPPAVTPTPGTPAGGAGPRRPAEDAAYRVGGPRCGVGGEAPLPEGQGAQSQRDREQDPAKGRTQVLELCPPGPTRLAAGQVLLDLGDVAAGEGAGHIGAKV